MPSFKDMGDATYQGELWAGNYDVNYLPSYYCSTSSPLPCQSAQLRTDVQLTVSGALDFDARPSTCRAADQKWRRDCRQHLPRQPDVHGKSGSSRTMPSFKDTGEATCQVICSPARTAFSTTPATLLDDQPAALSDDAARRLPSGQVASQTKTPREFL